MCLFAPLKSSTVPDMKWVLLKCLLIELDTNEVMVPFKAQSGGRRLAVVGGGGFLLPGFPTLPPPASCHTAAPPPPPQPQPAGRVTRRPARSPARPGSRWPMAAARASAGSLGALAAPCGPGWSWGTGRRRATRLRPERPGSRRAPGSPTYRRWALPSQVPARTGPALRPKPGAQRDPAVRAGCGTQRAKSPPSPSHPGPGVRTLDL